MWVLKDTLVLVVDGDKTWQLTPLVVEDALGGGKKPLSGLHRPIVVMATTQES
jgi:hypothetical protein